MERPPAGWYVDPDPVPKTPNPVRWWDGERWGDQQAWYTGLWVRHGSRFAGIDLFHCHHPWVAGWAATLVYMAPWYISDLLIDAWDVSLFSYVGWTLLLGLTAGFQNRRPGREPNDLPRPPIQPPRGGGPERRPLVA